MLYITHNIEIPDDEIELSAIRAQGPGGQNVNKVSSAIHLRFDVNASSLPNEIKQALFNSTDNRMTKDGILIIKAQAFRTQEKNKTDALKRLAAIIKEASTPKKKRIPTRASKSAKIKRVEQKVKRGKTKSLRGKINSDD